MSQIQVTSPRRCATKQNHNHNFDLSFLWKLLSTIFTALLAVVLLVWLVLRPSKPSLSVDQASLYRLSLSDTSLVNSSVQLTLRVSNPNGRLGIYYDEFHVSASYRGQRIADPVSFPPFYQGHEDHDLLSASLDGNNLPVGPYFGSEVAGDQVEGKLRVNFAMDGRFRWKVGTWVSGKYRINVECVTTMDFGQGSLTGQLTFRQGSQCSTVL
ncbi:hypothetical protein MLD38_025738 [Melastoma candidum]|uniref:Uncharacterized protein n=1 Tax=Melastoma candidum TaxID=119954 RepID=A0ACB9P1H2_9MYRT|nr:hypothetical protein MLD38_025738 [Melastoma candidum]